MRAQDQERVRQRDLRRAAWVLPIFVVLGAATHLGIVVTYGFAPLAMLVGYYFLRRSATGYLSLVVILFTFAPFVRRLADWSSAYHEPSPIILSPYLVALLVVFGLPKFDYRRPGALALVLATLGVGYGIAISVYTMHQPSTAKAFVRWSVPLLFGYYCLGQENKEELRQNFLTTTLWVAFIAAGYGVIQYVLAPPWDTFWMENLQAAGGGMTFGTPGRYGIRVFSTLASPGTCASMCGVGMLCATRIRTNWRLPVMLVFLTALALTLVRTNWISTALLLPIVIWRLPTAERLKTLASLPFIFLALILVAIPIVSSGGTAIQDRISSFGSLKKDSSAIVRSEGIHYALQMALEEPFGKGVGWFDTGAFGRSPIATMAGAGPYDTAFAEIPIELGYLGTLLYGLAACIGTAHLLRLLFTGDVSDSLLAAIGLIAWLVSGSQNPLIVYEGLLFWIAVCLTQAGGGRRIGHSVTEGKVEVGQGDLAVALR